MASTYTAAVATTSLDTLNTVAYGPNAPANYAADGRPRESMDSSASTASSSPAARAGRAPEESVAMLVRELFTRAREARRNVMTLWQRNYRALNNKQYRAGMSPWEEEPAVSSIWPTIASSVAWMTDQRPTIEVTPTAEAFSQHWDYYMKLAQNMNVCLNAAFTNYSLDGEITKVLWDTYTYGIGYFKTTWEAHLADGMGDTAFRRVDPFSIYVDPHAKNTEDCTYWIEAKQMTVDQVDRAWPGAGRKIGHLTWLEDTDEAPHRLDDRVQSNSPRVAMGAVAPATNPSYARSNGRDGPIKDAPVVTVLEAWVRGYCLEANDDPQANAAMTMKVSDEWRCIVVCGNRVLLDAPATEVNSYGGPPYDRMVLFDTGEWYGPCMVELLAPIQRLINWVLMAINRNIYLMGNPVLVEDMRLASRNKRFTNKPGQRLEGTPGQIGWLSPPQPHPQMSIQLVQYYESKIEMISGLSAMIRGFAPTGRNSEGVLDSVQDAAFVRVRATLRELEKALKGCASKMAANVGEFYTEPRLMSIIGPDGQQTHLALQERHFYTPAEYGVDGNGQYKEIGERVPLRFSLAADAGSQLPTSKQARAAEAQILFKLGAIDIFELLKAMQWPSYALVAQRVMQQQAQMAAAQPQKKAA